MTMPRRLVTPDLRIVMIRGSVSSANRLAEAVETARPFVAAWPTSPGLPSFVPCALRAARADFVRSEISRRSFLGQGGVEMQHERIGVGSEFGHDKGTRWAIKPEMKATSRESRSSLATTTGHL